MACQRKLSKLIKITRSREMYLNRHTEFYRLGSKKRDLGQIIKSWENRLDQEHCYALIQVKNIVKEETKAPLKQVIGRYFTRNNKRLSDLINVLHIHEAEHNIQNYEAEWILTTSSICKILHIMPSLVHDKIVNYNDYFKPCSPLIL